MICKHRRILEIGAFAGALWLGMAGCLPVAAQSSSVDIQQIGPVNALPGGNYVYTLQNGANNKANVNQQASEGALAPRNEASIIQNGDGNTALIGQSGQNNQTAIGEYGTGLRAEVVQQGANLGVTVNQYGIGNGSTVSVMQFGYGAAPVVTTKP
jgi:hypothetical protein